MSENKYLLRAPLLDSMQQVIGYKLAWQKKKKGNETPTGAHVRQLLTFLAERPGEFETGLLFLDARSAVLPTEVPQGMVPKNAVFMLNRIDLEAGNMASAMSLREQGFGLALCDVDLAFLESNDPLLPFVKYIEVCSEHPDLAAITNLVRHRQPQCAVVMDRILDWREFDACAALGLNGFFGNLCSAPHKLSPTGELGPQAVLILQLMQMIQENADIRQLEDVLKRDATLSYKLFLYINSASFGIEVEIQSLRHAVAMLGYRPLYRWLTLLLAMTNTAGFSPGLLQAAIVRSLSMTLQHG
jgi:c-di-GMP-related signal transduction protein